MATDQLRQAARILLRERGYSGSGSFCATAGTSFEGADILHRGAAA
jgi:hypothetical protein